jgi:PAS domain S-box-containing protein
MAKDELKITAAEETAESRNARQQRQADAAKNNRTENAVDIGDHQRAEDLLRQSENRFRTLAETASDAIITIDESGRIIFTNKSAQDAFGYSQQEMLGEELTTLMPEYLRHLHREGFARYKETGNRCISWEAIELRGLHKNGNEILLEISFAEFTQGDNRFFTGIARDITKRKRAEETLRRTELEYRSLVESMKAIVWRGNARTFQFSFISKEAETLLGYPAEQWTSDPAFWRDHIHAEDREWAVSLCVRATEEKRDRQFEYRMIAADGRLVWLRDIVRVVVEDGCVRELVGVMIDITERKLAEEALRQSEKKFSTIFQTIPDAVSIVRLRDGLMLDLNEASTAQTGYLKSERVGKTAQEFNLHIDQEARERLMESLIEKGEVTNREMEYRIKDDSLRYGLTSARVIELDGEQCAVAITRDITDLKAAEEAMRQSEAKFRTLAETTATGIVVSRSQDTKIRYVNSAMEAMSGYSQEELLEMTHWDLIHPDFHEIIRRRGLAWQTGELRSVRGELRLATKSGDERWVSYSAGAIEFEGESAMIATAFDITEGKRAEEALRRSEAHYRTLVENTPDIIARLDRDGRCLFVNSAIARVSPLKPEDFIGKTLQDVLFTQEQASFREEVIRRVFESSRSFETEFELQAPNGLDVYDWRVYPEFDAAGKVQSVLSINRNITERNRAEEQVKQSREQLRALSAHLQSVREEERTMIAREIHDELGQALTGLKMDLSFLQNGLSKAGAAGLSRLTERAMSMSRLIDQTIQTVRRIATDLRPGILDDLGLVAAIEWQAQDFQNRTGINCRFTPGVEDLGLDQDLSTAAFRIFQETLTNVARHSGATEVDVNLNHCDDSLALEITDNGKGISAAEISGSRSLGILGMRERASLLGGELQISGTPGEGTTVTLRIPLS